MSSTFFTTPASQRKRKRTDTSAAQSSKRHQQRESKSRANDPPRPQRKRARSEEISGSESDASVAVAQDVLPSESESGDEDETAAERRLRLAERYLENLKREVEVPDGFDATTIDRDLIAERLKEDVAETKGKIYKHIAGTLDWASAQRTFFSADQNGVTGVAVAPPYAYTVSKDGSVVKWELPPRPSSTGDEKQATNITPRRKPTFLRSFRANRSRAGDSSYTGHTSGILCCAASPDGRFLATGGADKRLVLWDVHSSGPKTLTPLRASTHHRDAVLALSFRPTTSTTQLFSASADRTIKTWSLDGGTLAYIETLFGHQDGVAAIAALPAAAETCVSVGSRDRTARLWKVAEESQLVFRGNSGGGGGSANASIKKSNRPAEAETADADADTDADADVGLAYDEQSLDAAAALDADTFVTGAANGALALWSAHRKKPVFTLPLAHGLDPRNSLAQSYAENHLEADSPLRHRQGRAKPRWITALAALPLADLIVSGSSDGVLRVWRLSADKRRLEAVGVLGEVKGVVASIAVVERGGRGKGKGGVAVLAGVAKGHRLGRWGGRWRGETGRFGLRSGLGATATARRRWVGRMGTEARDEAVRVRRRCGREQNDVGEIEGRNLLPESNWQPKRAYSTHTRRAVNARIYIGIYPVMAYRCRPFSRHFADMQHYITASI